MMFTYFRMLCEILNLPRTKASTQGGATLVEYALIVAVIALVLIGAGLTVGDDIRDIFIGAQTELQNANPSGT